MTIREIIIEAVIAALNTGTPGGVPAAQRSRSFPLDESDSICVYPVRETPETINGSGGSVVRADLRLAVEVRAKGAPGTSADKQADAALSWIVKALVKNRFSDGSGGHYALDTERGEITWEYEHGEAPVVLAIQEFIVTYQHLAANPDART